MIGSELRGHSRTLFRAGHRVRDGTTAWESFPRSMRDLRRRVRAAPERGSKCPGAPTSATCWEFLKGAGGLGTFARVNGIEPTNDAVERAPRRAVIWRRISGGPDGERGSRFVERMPTVVATGRQQGRNVLDYLTSCFEAQLAGQGIPPLPPAETVEIRVA